MAFDKPTRNRLAGFVGDARDLLAEEFSQQFQTLYGFSDRGTVIPLEQLGHLDETGLATAATLRERIDYLVKAHPDDREGVPAAVERLAREQAFTLLNRLVAIRMAEKRGLIVESVGKGYQSRGFKVFEQVAGSGLGHIYHRYRRYVFCLFDELAVDLGILFDRWSPHGLLFPREPALQRLLESLNASDLEPLWAEDETIGWVYQYYNDPAERKKMRDKSAAPRNSRELAVRNQFFTPRYVVEFLTDNTLGRIWYEMTKGQTRLADQCRYLIRRPTEFFLGPDEIAPEPPPSESMSQEELLKRPVHIPHRAIKDPREIRFLDPACGSMHFGLYAFDLYEVIYEEAWDVGVETLRRDYPQKQLLVGEVPRLIIEHNIHGIDIDPRAVQIAGLSLWLRAQRSWQAKRVPAPQRPRILRSNVVCAESMPGDREQLREFTAGLDVPALGWLVEQVFEKMQLAGEAGSLLKIEREARDIVAEAEERWKQVGLYGDPRTKPGPTEQPLDFTGIEEGPFWEGAEEKVYQALKEYAEAAAEHGYQRRLFADDAARGFAFLDVCRKQYDVAVMNPPFGEMPANWKKQASQAYPDTKNDIFAAFAERMLQVLAPGGIVGAITSRTGLFLTTFAPWRRKLMLQQAGLRYLVDLGDDVMDDAMVEAAAYCFDKGPSTTRALFIRVLLEADRDGAILASAKAVRTGVLPPNTFFVPLDQFGILPDGPFVYWSSRKPLECLAGWPSLKDAVAEVRQGLATADDPRFARLLWEVPPENWQRRDNGKQWVPYVKAGASQPWFSPITLLVNWGAEAAELWNNVNSQGKVRSNIWMLRDAIRLYFFKPGFSWTRRAVRFIPYIIPEGCIPSASRYMAYPRDGDVFSAVAVSASNVASVFLRFYGEMFQRPNYMVETVKLLPWPNVSESLAEKLKQHVVKQVQVRRRAYQNEEPFQEFTLPSLLWSGDATERSLAFDYSTLVGEELETEIAEAYGLTPSDMESLGLDLREALEFRRCGRSENEPADDEDFVIDVSARSQNSALISYLLGVVLGRWDLRLVTGRAAEVALSSAFSPVPVCSPGQLQNEQGLPLNREDVNRLKQQGCWEYPIEIPWDGILVDDSAHPRDLEGRLHEVLQIIWTDRWEALEQGACEILGVESLREYFRRPSGFFADHLGRYSKSRRQAPIYWPLTTARGSYSLWLYYHRLSDQTLHTVLADFVDPKIKAIQAEIRALRESPIHQARLDELLDLETELADFRGEIERIIKLPWKPNLNDGVVITASPLWRLFRLPRWQRDLKACWQKLEKGEYDWAHLAYSIWPRRVEEASKRDRSIAIAHGLEHLCRVEATRPKGNRGRKNITDAEDSE